MSKKLTVTQSNFLIQAKVLYISAKQKVLLSNIDSMEIVHFLHETDKLVIELGNLINNTTPKENIDDPK